jgi:hypothetical protein
MQKLGIQSLTTMLRGPNQRATYIALSAWLAAVSTACSPPSREYVSAEGRFGVLMPGDLREERGVIDTATGKREFVSVSAILNRKPWFANRGFYFVTYTDLSDQAVGTSPERLLDAEREEAVKRLNGKLVREQTVGLGHHTGRDIEVATQMGLVKERIYLVKQRVYQLVVGGKMEASSQDADRFFKSFRLLDSEGVTALSPNSSIPFPRVVLQEGPSGTDRTRPFHVAGRPAPWCYAAAIRKGPAICKFVMRPVKGATAS